jgi:hypothetical protein
MVESDTTDQNHSGGSSRSVITDPWFDNGRTTGTVTHALPGTLTFICSGQGYYIFMCNMCERQGQSRRI